MSRPARNVMLLTDANIGLLRSNRPRRAIADEGSEHLFLIVYPSGRKTWVWRGRINGRPQKLTLGFFPQCDVRTARTKASLITAEREAGRNAVTQHKEASRRERLSRVMTCDRAFELYIQNYCRERNKTWREKERIYNREVSPYIGQMPLIVVAP